MGPEYARLAARPFFGLLLITNWGNDRECDQFRPDSGETSNPSPQFYRRAGTRPKAPHQFRSTMYASCCLRDRTATRRLERGNELSKAAVIRVAFRTVPVSIDPLRMLRQQIAVQLLL